MMPVIRPRIFAVGIGLAVSLALDPTVMGAKPQASGPFAGWPQSWVDAYQRFEAYNAAREKYFPAANLEILSDGKISHSVQLFPGRMEHLTVDFFRNGRKSPGVPVSGAGDASGSQQESHMPPGTYAAGLKSCGLAGYQYLYPLLWFEISQSEPDISTERSTPDNARVRMIAPPHPSEDFWPNERMFKFFDFHVFPGRNPKEIQEKNAKVSPDITLRLTNSGTVSRDSLDAPLDKLLCWRIYHNGRLVKNGPAAEVTSFKADQGPGTYQAIVGVAGPNGFMPISNFLEFPLFPDRAGGFSVFPAVTNAARFPDFLLEILPPDGMQELMALPIEGQGDSYYNRRTIYFLNPKASFDAKDKDGLFKLWSAWGWDLANAINSTDSALGRTADKPKGAPVVPNNP